MGESYSLDRDVVGILQLQPTGPCRKVSPNKCTEYDTEPIDDEA